MCGALACLHNATSRTPGLRGASGAAVRPHNARRAVTQIVHHQKSLRRTGSPFVDTHPVPRVDEAAAPAEEQGVPERSLRTRMTRRPGHAGSACHFPAPGAGSSVGVWSVSAYPGGRQQLHRAGVECFGVPRWAPTTPQARGNHRMSEAPARSPSTTAAWARRGATQSPTRSTLMPCPLSSWYSESAGPAGTARTTQSGVRVTLRPVG